MEDLFERFTVSILRLNKLVQRIKIYEIKKFGLKSIHVMCLYYLNCHPEGLTASELVKLTLEDKAAISRALATMREEGYAEYDSATHNADVRLTPKGKQLAEYIVGRAAAAFDGLGHRMRKAFNASMRRECGEALLACLYFADVCIGRMERAAAELNGEVKK